MKTIKKFGNLYQTVGGGEGQKCLYPTRLDTYGQGCSHNCSYCYARALLEFRGLRHADNPKFIDLKEAYRIIAREIPEGQITRLGGMTDCFQPVERIHKITYNVLKAFKKCRKPYLIVSKSDLVATDEYIEVLDKDLAHIQITITSTDDELASTYEKATRPSIECKIRHGTVDERKIFQKYHYLSHQHRTPFPSKDIYVLEYKNEPIGYCSVQHFPHPTNKKLKKIHRLVIRPDYQGLGIGIRFLESVCEEYAKDGYDIRITTSSLSLLNGLKNSKNRICTSYGMGGIGGKKSQLYNNLQKTMAKDRKIGTFRYIIR